MEEDDLPQRKIMPLEDHFFTCECDADAHTLRFTYDPEENHVYVHYFLDNGGGFLARLVIGIMYIFGYRSKYGHFGEWIMKREDAIRLRDLTQKVIDNEQ